MSEELNQPLIFLKGPVGAECIDRPFVVVVRGRDELCRWLSDSAPAVQWLQIEGIIRDADAWAVAAQGSPDVPVDVVLSDPAAEFADLYRLVDVRAGRDVRVSMTAAPGFLKAVKLAASLELPVRLLPGQPSSEILAELAEALKFYLHDPMVQVPVEFFHSILASLRGADTGSLWQILEDDPAVFLHPSADGRFALPRSERPPPEGVGPQEFVEHYLTNLIEQGAECATCRWQQLCRGYFKWPDPGYSCSGVKGLFSMIANAADAIGRDLAEQGTIALTAQD